MSAVDAESCPVGLENESQLKNQKVRWNETGTYHSGNVEEVKDIATRLPYSGTAILVLAFI